MYNKKGSSGSFVEVLPGPLFLYTITQRLLHLYVSLYATSFFHICGTCPMQSVSGEGVVNAQLRVHGTQLLRVADASVFPRIPSAPTQATAMAVGHRAAELVVVEGSL
jgi:choline dehydrogenase-like flavoprotein